MDISCFFVCLLFVFFLFAYIPQSSGNTPWFLLGESLLSTIRFGQGWYSSRPFNLSQIPDCSYCPTGDPMWAKDGDGRYGMKPSVIMKPIQGQTELMMERHQVQMTLFKPLTWVAQIAEILLDFSDKIANAFRLLLSQFGLGFCPLQQNVTTIS